MITNGKDQLNKVLITTKGKKVGVIQDLYLDSDLTQVTAAVTDSHGLIHRTFSTIGRAEIQVYGEDAWIVSESAAPEEGTNGDGSKSVAVDSTTAETPGDGAQATIEEANAPVLLSKLHEREVRTEGGTMVGVIDDVILDGDACIIGFSFLRVYASGPISERRTIARKAITSPGSKDTPMTTILADAESVPIPAN